MFIRRPTATGAVSLNLALITWIEWAHRGGDGLAGVVIHFAGGECLTLALDAQETDQLQTLLGRGVASHQPLIVLGSP